MTNELLVEIRQEDPRDYPMVYDLHTTAFGRKEEARLTDRLRTCSTFIPELSLVAVYNNKVVGHIIFTEVSIVDENKETKSLALAPMSVLPELQRKGIGTQLINYGLAKAREAGYQSVIVLGHIDYYPRFGFKPTQQWGIKAPFNIPSNAFMGLELVENSLSDVKGIVKYSKEFAYL